MWYNYFSYFIAFDYLMIMVLLQNFLNLWDWHGKFLEERFLYLSLSCDFCFYFFLFYVMTCWSLLCLSGVWLQLKTRLNHKIYILTFWCNFLLLFGFGNWCFLLLLAIIEVIVLLLFWCCCTPVLPRDEFRFIRMRKYVDRLIYKIMSVKW